MSATADICAPRPATRPKRSDFERALKLHTSAFLSGRIGLVLPCYKLPLPVFIEDKMVVIETERHFVEMVRAYRHYVLKDGLQTVRGEFLGDKDNGDHLLIDTRFTFEYLDGRTTLADSTRYVRMNGDRMIVEMVENTTFPHHGTLAPE